MSRAAAVLPGAEKAGPDDVPRPEARQRLVQKKLARPSAARIVAVARE